MPKALLPSILPLNVPYRKQVQHADCLAACAAMVLDSDSVIALDPAFDASPFYISRGDFELAWGNADYACAIITPQQQE